MKLKNILAFSFFAMAFAACETVDEDERFIGPVDFEPKKNVLIEDFTGQRCINCPKAAEVVHQLQETYGKEHVIAVAIHGGSLSIPAPAGLATEESKAYTEHWKVESWPKGLVNRNGGLDEYTSWTARTIAEFMQEAGADIQVKPRFDADKRELSLKTVVTSKVTAEGKLQLWLVENNITGYQSMPDGSHNRNYVHNHVFRTAINDMLGEAISLTAGEQKEYQHTYTLADAKWKAENMAVVAIVADASNQVLQVVETPLLPTQP